jgi:hypothetical protein
VNRKSSATLESAIGTLSRIAATNSCGVSKSRTQAATSSTTHEGLIQRSGTPANSPKARPYPGAAQPIREHPLM